MLEQYGHNWIDDNIAYIIRSYAQKNGCDVALAFAHAYYESTQYPWALGDEYHSQKIWVNNREYTLPYFPHRGTYVRSFGLFQINMAGGLGADLHPRWWEIINVMNNCELATRSLAYWQGMAERDGRKGYDWFYYISTNAGWPGSVPYDDPNMRARYDYFVRCYQNPAGGWAVWPPFDTPRNPFPAQPYWLCQAEPPPPDGYSGWCVGVAKYTLGIAVLPAGSGTTAPPPGQHIYDEGTPVTITATPNTGWVFDRWLGDATGVDPTVTVIMNRAKWITAQFQEAPPPLEMFSLGISVTPEEGGYTNPAADIYTYQSGQQVWITATANHGWRFVQWEGSFPSRLATISLIMDSDKWVNAVFERENGPPPPPICVLSIRMEPIEGGTVSPPLGDNEYVCGTEVTIRAIPKVDWEFVEWTGHISSTQMQEYVLLDRNKVCIANFRPTTDGAIPPKPLPIGAIPTTLRGIKDALKKIQPFARG